jgi:hypothetical protein
MTHYIHPITILIHQMIETISFGLTHPMTRFVHPINDRLHLAGVLTLDAKGCKGRPQRARCWSTRTLSVDTRAGVLRAETRRGHDRDHAAGRLLLFFNF